MRDIVESPVTIDAPGAALIGTLTSVSQPTLAVSINGATGVPASFYLPFARWLALEKNAAVLTWDYRDFGKSGTPYHSAATMTDWAITDPTATRLWLEARFPGTPLWVIGHSLGGMGLAFQPGTERLDRIITVAAGHGHISAHPWPFRIYAYLLWYLFGPLSTALLGYLPGRRLNLGNDLPKGVFWQWRAWLLDRRSLPADPKLGGIKNPGYQGAITLIALADDPMIPPGSVRKMASWHPNAQCEHTVLTPATFGLTSIRHIHAFAARNSAVWPSLIAPYGSGDSAAKA